MDTTPQDELKTATKLWLKANGLSYAWLAGKCFVTEATLRNWMARKPIPEAKAYIIRELMRQLPITMPIRPIVQEETRITLSLDPVTRARLEKNAFRSGKTLTEYLADEVGKKGATGE